VFVATIFTGTNIPTAANVDAPAHLETETTHKLQFNTAPKPRPRHQVRDTPTGRPNYSRLNCPLMCSNVAKTESASSRQNRKQPIPPQNQTLMLHGVAARCIKHDRARSNIRKSHAALTSTDKAVGRSPKYQWGTWPRRIHAIPSATTQRRALDAIMCFRYQKMPRDLA